MGQLKTAGPRFEQYDESVAERFMQSNDGQTGLPKFLGARFVEFGPGVLRAELEVRDELLTPFKNMHGGVIAAFVDHVLGCVMYPLMKRGQWAATTEFKLNYLAPVTEGTVTAEARVVSLTRTMAVVRIEVSNGDRLVAAAQGTVTVRDRKA